MMKISPEKERQKKKIQKGNSAEQDKSHSLVLFNVRLTFHPLMSTFMYTEERL